MYQRFSLKNGTRVVLVPYKETKAVTVLVLYKVGSRYESSKINGVSHFIEHLMFKGTKKRPNTLDISRALDSVGAEYNAFTSKDYTGYYIKANYEHLDLALDILFDMLHHSKFEAAEIDRERTVVIEEINMYEDNPLMHVEDIFEETLYINNSLGWKISGGRDNVSSITRDEILKYRDTYYDTKRAVVAIAGNLPLKTRELLDKTFGASKVTKKLSREFRRFAITAKNFRAPRFRLSFKETEQVQVALGVPSYPYLHPKLPALSLLSVILGGTMSSRLFTEVRERRGLAYMVRSSVGVYEDVGNIMIHAGLDKARVEEALKTILDEVQKVKKNGVTKEELNRAKENIRGHLTLSFEESSNRADWFGKQELLVGALKTPEEKLAELFKVSQKDIQDVARDLFKTERLSAAMIGPFKENGQFLKLLKV